MRVPFVDLKRDSQQQKEEIYSAINNVIESSSFILGEQVESFEAEFAYFCGKKYGVGVSSGTDAIFLALKALGVGAADEVITAANTYIATFNAISMTSAKPVPVDVEPYHYNIDCDAIESAINERTKAIVPVHLYGQMAEMDRVVEIAEKKGIPIVEDASQAHGAFYRGKRSGSFGLAACFSFYPSKNLGCYGDGGIVVTDDEEIASKIRRLRNYGQETKNHHLEIGYNKRLDEIQAAVLRVKLRNLDAQNRMRINAAKYYAERLKNIEDVVIPTAREEDFAHVYHLYVIRCKKRDALRDYLSQKQIETAIHYPMPPHLQPAYAFLGYEGGDFPVSESLCGQILSLPMFPGITREEIDWVCDCIAEFYSRENPE